MSLHSQSLETTLQQQDVTQLAKLCDERGNAARGAVLFFEARLACNKCHSVNEVDDTSLGPNLAKLDRNTTNESLVESILEPSKNIRDGFKAVTVLRTDGQVQTGIVIEQNSEAVRLKDPSDPKQTITIKTGDIEEIKTLSQSLMPSGQINLLDNAQQFFDLVKYLIEIREGGFKRAEELQPSAMQLTLQIPEYESNIDHAGMIQNLDDQALTRGEAIYRRVCQSCHGTLDEPGSLPTSLRFAEGKFKNGSDPYSMYSTLTRGYGLMTPQSWMVPSQKYDVIHFIREKYLKTHNSTQYTKIDQQYLASLPKGDSFGPEPSTINPWNAMDYGPMLAHTYQIPGDALNFAYKGIAVQLDSNPGGIAKGKHWMVFDTDTLRIAAGWSSLNDASDDQNFINWRSIQFNGEHNIHPTIAGDVQFANASGAGWANIAGSFDDSTRITGRDNRRYGPIAKEHGKFLGTYQHGQRVIFAYEVAKTRVLESPSVVDDGSTGDVIFERTFEVQPHQHELQLRIADEVELHNVRVVPASSKVELVQTEFGLTAKLAANDNVEHFKIQLRDTANASVEAWDDSSALSEVEHLSKFTQGGPQRWPFELTTQVQETSNDGPFAVETLMEPISNPWNAQLRFTGLDFLPDGRVAAGTWDGDVWMIREHNKQLHWKRIANGLFQPLGLKVIDGKIYLTCRDQLAILHDLNGDEEIDFVECFNNDHQVTEHFHEFAMGLQVDHEGNLYYAKSARHALPALVPHHGTLLRIARDGSRTDILANGFRAANGVCLNPDGSFVVTDQEGHWNPKNRINWVTVNDEAPPKFYGNMFGYSDHTDESDTSMEQPLCWITNAFDRSPAELLWVDSPRWGALNNRLLNLSYGYGKVYLVPHEFIGGQAQGGMIELPIPQFPTGIILGRFNPNDGQLYVCGMYSWAGSQIYPGAIYRIRATGKPYRLPVSIHAKFGKVELEFSEPIDAPKLNSSQFEINVWSLKRTKNYGSKHIDKHNLKINKASLSEDGKTIELLIEDLQPTWCMEIKYRIPTADGETIEGKIHNTIHRLESK